MRISDWSSDVCSSDLDVDVHELAVLGVDLDGARVAVGPAVADAEHEVGPEKGGVAVAVAGLQADHAGHQRDRKRVVSGKSVSVRVDLGGRRFIKKKKYNIHLETNRSKL